MSQSLLKTIRNASLVGATVLATWFAPMGKLLALPQEAIIQKLQSVPVFTVADEAGAPLVATGNDTKNRKIAGVFMSRNDANNFIAQLKKNNPELGSKVQVVPVSLGEVYEMAEANAKETDGINFAYVPNQVQVEEAKKLNSKYEGGVPLFVATAGENQGYLTMKQGEEEFIPFFFEKAQVRDLVDQFTKAQPNLASSIKIEVVVLEGMISAMQRGDDEVLQKIILWPSNDSLQFIRENTPSNSPSKK
ncbi:MAG: hypothetical protein IGQ45_06120 [Cyanobacterium sp. T60_A2020_053]|nr:hypothetical protein [Cyanobacterium sp. T60_A2020_053]